MRGRWVHTRTKANYPDRYHTTNEIEAGAAHDGWTFSLDRWTHTGGATVFGHAMTSHGGWDWTPIPSTVPVTISTPLVITSKEVPPPVLTAPSEVIADASTVPTLASAAPAVPSRVLILALGAAVVWWLMKR